MRQTLENIYYQYSAFSIFFFFFFSEYLNPLEVWFLAIAGRQSWWRPKIIEIRSCPSFLLLTNCFFLEKLGREHSLKGLFTVSTTQKGKCRPWSRGFMGRLLFFFNVFIFGCAGSLLLWGLFSGCGERGAQGSHCGGFSRCKARALEHTQCSCGACGIFLDKGSNPCPLHWQVNSLPLSH